MIYYGYHHSFHYQRQLLFRHHQNQIIVGRRRADQGQDQGQK